MRRDVTNAPELIKPFGSAAILKRLKRFITEVNEAWKKNIQKRNYEKNKEYNDQEKKNRKIKLTRDGSFGRLNMWMQLL